MARKDKPSVIITDNYMPDGDAQYLLYRLRSSPATDNIPVFMIGARKLSDLTEADPHAGDLRPSRRDASVQTVVRYRTTVRRAEEVLRLPDLSLVTSYIGLHGRPRAAAAGPSFRPALPRQTAAAWRERQAVATNSARWPAPIKPRPAAIGSNRPRLTARRAILGPPFVRQDHEISGKAVRSAARVLVRLQSDGTDREQAC